MNRISKLHKIGKKLHKRLCKKVSKIPKVKDTKIENFQSKFRSNQRD